MKQFLLRFFPINKFVISGRSMIPLLQDGSIFFVNRLSYLFKNPRIGDVVAVKDPRDKKVLIKRITNFKKNKYFIMGDNKKHSTDSRSFGMIIKKDIIGKVIF